MAKRASPGVAGTKARVAKATALPKRTPAKATSGDPAKTVVEKDAKPSSAKTAAGGKAPAAKSAGAKTAAAKAAAARPSTPKPSTPKPSAVKSLPAAAAKPVSPTRKAKKAPEPSSPAETAASRPSKRAPRSAKPGKDAAAAPPRDETKRKPEAPHYLAAELGQPVDNEGEPVGAGSARARSDDELQRYSLQLWRQMQTGRVTARYTRAIEKAGLTIDEVWTAGLVEVRATSSTPDELRRYRQKLLFRANLLEAILTETIADLHRLDNVEPTVPAAGPA